MPGMFAFSSLMGGREEVRLPSWGQSKAKPQMARGRSLRLYDGKTGIYPHSR